MCNHLELFQGPMMHPTFVKNPEYGIPKINHNITTRVNVLKLIKLALKKGIQMFELFTLILGQVICFLRSFSPCISDVGKGTRRMYSTRILYFIYQFFFFISFQGNGWKVVASFEGNFPNRIKQLPIDRHFDINNVKRVNLLH